MDAYAVAGRPVLHSRSPQIFNGVFRSLGRDARYTRLAAESAADAVRLFRALDLAGMNVTAPFKESLAALVDDRDSAAQATGAVNTVVRDGPRLKGANTDPLGVAGALGASGAVASGRRCFVIGAGGAGRAAAHALLSAGGEVWIADIEPSKSERAASEIGGTPISPEAIPGRLEEADIIVAAVPGGSFTLEGLRIRPGAVLMEADYRNPVLRSAAAERGLLYIGGIEWLKHQARPALALFLGPAAEKVGADWAAALGEPGPGERPLIALTGFMGSGKSAVGRALAERLGWEFADTDAWIEGREGMSVRAFFETRGEPRFRALEREAVARFASARRLVLSCGGGAVLDPANRAALAASAWSCGSMPR